MTAPRTPEEIAGKLTSDFDNRFDGQIPHESRLWLMRNIAAAIAHERAEADARVVGLKRDLERFRDEYAALREMVELSEQRGAELERAACAELAESDGDCSAYAIAEYIRARSRPVSLDEIERRDWFDKRIDEKGKSP